MRTAIIESLRSVLVLFLLVVVMQASAGGLVAMNADRVAIGGYDAVAYFTDGKASEGSGDFEYLWDDAKWHFASAVHRDMFMADPDRYAPQFGGFCTGSIGSGELVRANPKIWAIVGGKLYMSAGSTGDFAADSIVRANNQWPIVQANWAAQ